MVEEKIFIINLKKEFMKKPLYKRAKKAVTAVKEYITQHLKVEKVKIGSNLNMHIWTRGKRHPPSKVKVHAYVKEKTAYVELDGFQFEEFKITEKDEKHDTKHHEHSEKEEKNKEQEKELLKETKHEDEVKQHKGHKHEVKEEPTKGVKTEEKVMRDIKKQGRVVGDTGKKPARKS